MGIATKITSTEEVGRLALRVEGGMWRSYYADNASMDGAYEIGSIAMELVKNSAMRKKLLITLMTDAVGDIIHRITNQQPTWGDPSPAPEHERSGRA